MTKSYQLGLGLPQMRQWIREQKNSWIQQYFQWRITSEPSAYQVLFRKRPYRILFILSHMRSGSSLLTHLINTNPEIIGYGETHLEYASEQDFNYLLQKVYWQTQEFRTIKDIKNLRMHHSYVMDKVLHDKKFLSYDFLQSDQAYSIFLLRDPARSLTSILDLKPHWDEQTALKYYGGRLTTLAEYARFINDSKRALLITYEQLLQNTQDVLSLLQQFLDTQGPFSEEYQVLKTTGMKGIGDSKGNIKAGKILRSQRQLNQQITDDTLESAQSYYHNSLSQLLQHCTTLSNQNSTSLDH